MAYDRNARPMLITRLMTTIFGCALLVCMAPSSAPACLGNTEHALRAVPGAFGVVGLPPDALRPEGDAVGRIPPDDALEDDAVEAGAVRGDSFDLDASSAVATLRQEADGGKVEAQYELGMAYTVGVGVERDPKAAAAWMEKAALQGFPEAVADLGVMYLNGDGVPRDWVMACALLLAAVERAAPAEIRPEEACNRLSTDDRNRARRISEDPALWRRH